MTARSACRWLAPLVLAVLAAGAAARAADVVGIGAIGITVSDMDRALAFYTGVLPFEVVADSEVHGSDTERLLGIFGARVRVVRLRLGDEQIELIEYIASPGRPIPVDSHSNDHWFQHIAIIVRDMDAAYAHLRRHDVTHASTGPQTLPDWNPDAGGISAFYFRDPDGNHLEILQFPPGKGAARWHAPGEDLFLGIDHSAIVVRDTDEALRFYRDTLGLKVVGGAENYGIEQERLNNVFGARLRITALAGPAGPAIEFLEYLSPATGRPVPVDTGAHDLWHWQINVHVDDAAELGTSARKRGGRWVSPGAVTIEHDWPRAETGLMLRDPTGHALLLLEGG